MARITARELELALAIAAMGFVFSSREFLLYLNLLNPVEGIILYYVVLYVVLYALSRMGLVVFGFRIKNASQTIGLLLMNFAFFATVDWSSPWVQFVITGSTSGAANALTNNCEDGLLWWVATVAFNITNLEIARYVAFVVLVFIIALAGLYLVEGEARIDA